MRQHGSGAKGDCRAEVVTVRQLVLRSRVNGVGGKSRRRPDARLGGKESERISVRERTEVDWDYSEVKGRKIKKAKRRNGRSMRGRRSERQKERERRPKTGTRTERDEPGWTVEGDGDDYERACPYYYRTTGAILPHRRRGAHLLPLHCV